MRMIEACIGILIGTFNYMNVPDPSTISIHIMSTSSSLSTVAVSVRSFLISMSICALSSGVSNNMISLILNHWAKIAILELEIFLFF